MEYVTAALNFDDEGDADCGAETPALSLRVTDGIRESGRGIRVLPEWMA